MMLKAISLVLFLWAAAAQAQSGNENPFAKPSPPTPAQAAPVLDPSNPTGAPPSFQGVPPSFQGVPPSFQGAPPSFNGGAPVDPSLQGGQPYGGLDPMTGLPQVPPSAELRVPVTRIGVVNGQAILKGEHGYFFEKLDKKSKSGGRVPVETLPGAGGKPAQLPVPNLPPNGQREGAGWNGGGPIGYNGMGPYSGQPLYPGHVTNAPR